MSPMLLPPASSVLGMGAPKQSELEQVCERSS